MKEVKSRHRETGIRLIPKSLGTGEQPGPKISEERKLAGIAA